MKERQLYKNKENKVIIVVNDDIIVDNHRGYALVQELWDGGEEYRVITVGELRSSWSKFDLKTQVVYNSDYGGFDLSEKAMRWLKKNGWDDEKEEYPYPERHDPLLVRCVLELGKEAGGPYSTLEVETIDSPFYVIQEYDGWETVVPSWDMVDISVL